MMYLVRTSIDEERRASIVAREIVESKSAVSVHIREIKSVYSWEGKVEEDIEWEVECITTCPTEVESLVRGMHPYELPEIIITKLNAPSAIQDWCKDWCLYEEEITYV